MKTVAVVGAGPAGLVAAKVLLRCSAGDFKVTVFEKQDRVGGMWALKPDDLHRGKCNPRMPTNLTRFAVLFSDLAWQSVDLKENGSESDILLPMYPKAWQVGRYLEEYARRYIPEDCLKLSCQVQSASKVNIDNESKWRVQWLQAPPLSEDTNTNSVTDINGHAEASNGYEEGLFDHVIVGPGFFGSPKQPTFVVKDMGELNVLHSSKFRVIDDLIHKPYPAEGSIVVVGGGMSGSEAAIAVAMAQSNATHAPDVSDAPPAYKIIHLTARPFYDIPRMSPQNSKDLPEGQVDHAPGFLPNDLSSFNLSKTPAGPIVPKNNGLVPPEKAEEGHPWMHSIIGGDQSDIGSEALRFSPEHKERAGYIGITDSYTEFARSGVIKAILGRATRLSSGLRTDTAVLEYRDEAGKQHAVENVVGVIYATGFTPLTSLSWLDAAILQDLEYDARCERLPFLLSHHTTYHPSHPNLGFVGCYEGAFWAVMEAQAREIAWRWSASSTGEPTPLAYEEPNMYELRKAILESRSDVPQFWMRDYLSIVDSLAGRHGIKRDDSGFGERAGPITAARYTTTDDDVAQARLTISDLQDVLQDQVKKDRFVAAAIFRGLQGSWDIVRKLESFLPGFPSGTLQGSAQFAPRFPTDGHYSTEHLYIERGTLTTNAGLTLNANKRYAYRYSESRDQISVWFVKEDGKTIDYLFHAIELSPRSDRSCNDGWRATGSHWCDPDQYECSYAFKFKGASMFEFTVKFIVKGPNKDYVSETRFTRPKIEG